MKNVFFALAVALLLAGCVNLHVHFPPAPAERAGDAGDEARPQGNPGGEVK